MILPPKFLLVCLAVALFSCSGRPKKPKVEGPPGTEEFKTQVMKFIEEGTNTNAKASQGVSHGELREQVVSTKAAHDLMLAVWPKDFATDAHDKFDKAVEGWELTLELWGLKINKGDNPTAPNINGFDRYLGYGVEEMKVERYGKDYLVEAYRGRNFLPFDANIEVLLKLAGTSFDTGRGEILSALEEKRDAE